MDERTFQNQSAVLWSKSDRKQPDRMHLLIYHLIDTAAVALQLWHLSLSTAAKSQISSFLEIGIEEAGTQIAFWASLHDIGKASPVFQQKVEVLSSRACQLGFTFGKNLDSKVHHSIISAKFLRDSQLVPRQVDIAISGHHGAWNGNYSDVSQRSYGKNEWQVYRIAAVERLADLLGIDQSKTVPMPEVEAANVFAVWLSGFISVADWIASNEDYFKFKQEYEDLQNYFLQYSKPKAVEALHQLGWIGWKPQGKSVSFQDMYPYIQTPRPIQAEVVNIYNQIAPQHPFILILEAPTGIGKTEIALYIADQWLQASLGSGLYIAMPTQATSNQIYDRTVSIIKHRYPDDLLSITLAHGQAIWNERVNAIRVKEVGIEDQQTVVAAEWFQNNRKRTLLTPFGVGTVDQVFLGILQTKHFFVRLFGLHNKVVIFDEVHAYDIYMQELFNRLLNWLRSLNVSVIILSATLTDNFRKEIVQAYSQPGVDDDEKKAYPRLTIAIPGQLPKTFDLHSLIPNDQKPLRLAWKTREELLPLLAERLQVTGCVAVICNTVSNAQKLYQALNETLVKSGMIEPENLILFHARYPHVWRQEIEETVKQKFGKDPESRFNEHGEDENPNRPKRAIVIATQVIEQSLDLDFDLMVSEVAPVDLMIQRVGRLHRHKRQRPDCMEDPELILLTPEIHSDGAPDFGGSARVYPKSILLKTYLLLNRLEQLHVVCQTRDLIEKVYSSNAIDFEDSGFKELIENWQQKEAEKSVLVQDKAKSVVILPSDNRNLLYSGILDLKEDDTSGTHRAYRAMTRDTDGISLQLVCLHQKDDSLYLEPECLSEPIDFSCLDAHDPRITLILERGVSLGLSDIVEHLLEEGVLLQVENIPALRHARIMSFVDGSFKTNQYQFYLSRELGLIVNRI